MYFALGAAAAGAADLLSSILPSKAAGKAKTGVTQNTSSPFGIINTAATPPSSGATPSTGVTSQSGVLTPQTMSALFAAQDPSQSTPTSKTDALKSLFGALDGNGDGQISKSEFTDKLGAGGTNTANAGKVFGKLDANGDGSVSLDELTSALTTKKGHGAQHAHGGGKGGEDALMKALDGASSTSTSNSDGSTTTTMTYADGSTVTLTTPPASSSNSNASKNALSSYNLIEQMIQKQADSLALSAKQSLSIKV